MVLGGVMCLSNLYVGLKTGWGLGVAITACILSFSIGAGLKKIGLLRTNLTILENNCMQSTASSAGYSTGSAMVGAVSALLMIRGEHLPFWTLLLWTIFLAILGVMLAIPMKRQMINVEQLKFPSGVAAAQTLCSLYASGGETTKQARSLGVAGLLGAVVAFARSNTFFWYPKAMKIPQMLEIPGTIAGQKLAQWTISWDMSVIMVAAGSIIGIRIAWSMLLGGLFNYGYLSPMIYGKSRSVILSRFSYSPFILKIFFGFGSSSLKNLPMTAILVFSSAYLKTERGDPVDMKDRILHTKAYVYIGRKLIRILFRWERSKRAYRCCLGALH